MITISLDEFKGRLQNLPLHPYTEPLYTALSEAVNEIEANKQYKKVDLLSQALLDFIKVHK